MYSVKVRRNCDKLPHRQTVKWFAIVGNPRTGSSHLASLLDSHPDIACWNGEIFNTEEAFDRSNFASATSFLLHHAGRTDARVAGFKLLIHALERPRIVEPALTDLNVHFVHCLRSNRLASFVSAKLATLNGAFTSWAGSYRESRCEVNLTDLSQWISSTRAADERIRHCAHRLGLPLLEVEYSAARSNHREVLDYLGVHEAPLHSKLTKQRSLPLADVVENYDEVSQYLRNLGCEDWLTD